MYVQILSLQRRVPSEGNAVFRSWLHVRYRDFSAVKYRRLFDPIWPPSIQTIDIQPATSREVVTQATSKPSLASKPQPSPTQSNPTRKYKSTFCSAHRSKKKQQSNKYKCHPNLAHLTTPASNQSYRPSPPAAASSH
jgi:hypothetical protein